MEPEVWHGEAYFGLLTRGLPNVVQHRGSFPVKRRNGMRYILVLDLETGGTVEDWLDAGNPPWTAKQVVKSLRALARTLEKLHASGATHRDIKPANVFIGNRRSLSSDWGTSASRCTGWAGAVRA